MNTHKPWTHLVHVLTALLLCTSAAGCTMVGRGHTTVIKATLDPNDHDAATLLERYPHMIVKAGDPITSKVSLIAPSGNPPSQSFLNRRSANALRSFHAYMQSKYGDPTFLAAKLSYEVRDQNLTPTFAATDAATSVAKMVTALVQGATKFDPDDALKRERFAAARLNNVPELQPATALHHINKDGIGFYYYYPRIQIDFSAELMSPSLLDRFSFIGFMIRVKQEDGGGSNGYVSACGRKDAIRIVNNSPKAADFIEYTRGTLTDSSSVQAKGTYGATNERTTSSSNETKVGDATVTIGSGATRTGALGGELSYTLSEQYVSELKDAIERRNVGYFDCGSGLYAQFRSIRGVRIGGTYSFDLMLEIPSKLECDEKEKYCPAESAKYYSLAPIAKDVRMDIDLIGIVRHVHDRGLKGVFYRVPEVENDDVYEQVVLQSFRDSPLWQFTELSYALPVDRAIDSCTIKVLTNRDDAQYVLRDAKGDFVARGEGKQGTITVGQGKTTVLTFLPIVDSSGKGGPTMLTTHSPRNMPKCQGKETFTEIGDYAINP